MLQPVVGDDDVHTVIDEHVRCSRTIGIDNHRTLRFACE